MESNLYKAPKSKTLVEKQNEHPERDESAGRRNYVIRLFAIFILLPLLSQIFGDLVGYNLGAFTTTAKFDAEGNLIGNGVKLNMLSIWPISIVLFFYVTYLRVKDTGMNAWFTLLFILPVINIIIWFWPPKSNKKP